MSEEAILGKLRFELQEEITSERQVVYVLVEVRKMLHLHNESKAFSVLSFYCNWAAQGAVLENFFPITVSAAPLPKDVPPDIQAEFREAEQCAAFGANRAASALFRSVLEKTLKANGYIKSNDPTLRDLQKRIDAAAGDGVITDARRKRAHDDIRSLGNDVLHDDWREIKDDEVEDSHRYTQRILEDLYDDRASVEAILIAKKRLTVPSTHANP